MDHLAGEDFGRPGRKILGRPLQEEGRAHGRRKLPERVGLFDSSRAGFVEHDHPHGRRNGYMVPHPTVANIRRQDEVFGRRHIPPHQRNEEVSTRPHTRLVQSAVAQESDPAVFIHPEGPQSQAPTPRNVSGSTRRIYTNSFRPTLTGVSQGALVLRGTVQCDGRTDAVACAEPAACPDLQSTHGALLRDSTAGGAVPTPRFPRRGETSSAAVGAAARATADCGALPGSIRASSAVPADGVVNIADLAGDALRAAKPQRYRYAPPAAAGVSGGPACAAYQTTNSGVRYEGAGGHGGGAYARQMEFAQRGSPPRGWAAMGWGTRGPAETVTGSRGSARGIANDCATVQCTADTGAPRAPAAAVDHVASVLRSNDHPGAPARGGEVGKSAIVSTVAPTERQAALMATSAREVRSRMVARANRACDALTNPQYG